MKVLNWLARSAHNNEILDFIHAASKLNLLCAIGLIEKERNISLSCSAAVERTPGNSGRGIESG